MLGEPAPDNQDIRWTPGGAEMAAAPPIVEVWPLSSTSLSDFAPFGNSIHATPVFDDPMMGSNNSMLADMGCHCGSGMGCCGGGCPMAANLSQSVPADSIALDAGNGSFAVGGGMGDITGGTPKAGLPRWVVPVAVVGLGLLLLRRMR